MNTKSLRQIVLAGSLLATAVSDISANPTGGQVVSGAAGITTVPGTVTINQQSNIAIINWQSFSISSGELTKFVQPSSTSAALNRVLGGQTSLINGTLSANGQVYLINGNGIVVGPGGMVNTNSFTASTRDISDADFLAGNLHFSGSSSAGVQNFGTINALGGDVYLIGKTVDNQGTINAANGTAGMASADDVVLNLNGDEHVFVSPSPTVTSASSQTAVHNSGTIAAASAELKAANGNVFALAINNEGTIRATSVAQKGGRIFLTTNAGLVQNTGTISAKAGANGGQVKFTGGSVWNRKTIDVSGAKGGSVTASVANFQNDGAISVKGTQGAGGSVSVTHSGNALGSVTGSIDASGTTQGGSIDFLGTGATSEAYLSLTLDASSGGGAGGSIDIDASSVYLTGATLNANGATGGGRIFVGEGDPLLSAGLAYAQTAYVSTGTTISASATASGNGGQIGMAGTVEIEFHGTAAAAGAGATGTAGDISVSGTNTSGAQSQFVTLQFNSNLNIAVVQGTSSDATGTSFEFVDPDPGPNNAFGRPGSGLFNLSSNNTLITSPGDAFGGAGAGAAYLFSDANGALLSTLRGSHAGDGVGTTVQTFSGSSFVILSPAWNGNMGAVSFGSGTTGFAAGGGDVSSTNSLVGSTAGDRVGSGGLTQLANGDYLILSPLWNSSAGAVTWVNPTVGVTGAIGSANSLVGAAAGDAIGGGGIRQLSNESNYLVLSPSFDGGAGAVTNGSDAAGVSGTVSATNSLVGSSSGDAVGSSGSILDEYTYYLVKTANWNGGAGAVTWNSESTGTVGAISASNSLVGSSATDQVGSGGITFSFENGSYLVSSPHWNSNTGAATLGSTTGGISGVVSSANSLVGAASGDQIGSGGVTALNNIYLVSSPLFNGSAGAVTAVDASEGRVGTVSASNSLVGASQGDSIGSGGITSLYNGSFVILSPSYAGGAGAVTWEDASGSVVGTVSASNSLVGAATGDSIGSGGIMSLSDGTDYLVLSPSWGGGKGAVTQGENVGGITGVVSNLNSLVGAAATDAVGSEGSITDATAEGGYYLVYTPNFNVGGGAVTWSSTTSDGGPTTGVVSAVNSLVGNRSDNVGSGGITILDSGNYVVSSPNWSGGTGGVTFGTALSGATGVVSASNSLVGASQGDGIGSGGILQLNNGQNFLVLSPNFGGGAGAITNESNATGLSGVVSASNSLIGASTTDGVGSEGSVIDTYNGYYLVTTLNWGGGAGGVTWNNENNGTFGVISASNSLVGTAQGDQVGSGGITFLDNGNYLVVSPNWNGQTGAVTWGSSSSGVSGVVSASNSLVGANSGDQIGSAGIDSLDNGNYLVLSPNFNSGAGAVTWGDQSVGVAGVVSASNSLVGTNSSGDGGAGDQVGSGGIVFVGDSNYLVVSPNWNNATGAVTFGNGATGISGTIDGANSLIGQSPGDSVGSGGVQLLSNGSNYLVLSPTWGGGAGAITNGNVSTGVTGVVSESNSLVGASSGDGVGSEGSVLDTYAGYYLVTTSNWGNGAGAVTWNSDTAGTTGQISASNSLVGSNPTIPDESNGDNVGGGGLTVLYYNNDNYVVQSPDWNNGAGAVTFGSAAGGVSGVVSASNSLVGAGSGDEIGSGGIRQLSNGSYLVMSPLFNGNAGAVTFAGLSGVSGTVSAANSLVGAASGDAVGSGGISVLSSGNFLVLSPSFDGGAGAVTFGSATSGVTGTVSSANSLVGASSTDHIGSGGIIHLPGSNYLVLSPLYNGSAGAATWGSGTSGVDGVVGASNSIVGGGPNSGEEYAGLSSDGSIYLIAFTTDTSKGGDGRVLAGSVNGPSSSISSSENFFTDQGVIAFANSGFGWLATNTPFYISDPDSWTTDTVSVGTDTGGALNDGKGKNLASGSSTSNASGPRRLVTPGNGVWNIFGGAVHSVPPPAFVLQQLQLNLNPTVLAELHNFVFGNH